MGFSLPLWLYRQRLRLQARTEAAPLPPADALPPGPRVLAHTPMPLMRAKLAALASAAQDDGEEASFVITDAPPAGGTGTGLFALPQLDESQAAALLDRFDPGCCLHFSSTMSPLLIAEAQDRAIPQFLIADGSPAFHQGGGALRGGLARALMASFDTIFVEDETAFQALGALGLSSDSLRKTGPLIEAIATPPGNDHARNQMAGLLRSRPSWLATDVGLAELDLLTRAQRHATRYAHRLLLVITPQTPDSGADLARHLRGENWRVALRSAGETPDENIQIVIADQGAELGLWLRLCPVCLICQTFFATAGMDPFIPAALGAAVLHGPRTGAHLAHYTRLKAARAARTAADADGLCHELNTVLSPETAAEMAHNAWSVATQGAEATQDIAHLLVDAAFQKRHG